MNIQIYGKSKCFDTKKAQRYFKERKVKVQSIDMATHSMSNGEFQSVKKALGSLDAMIDQNAKDKDILALITYLTPQAKEEKVFENQRVVKTPIVRNGRQATIGFCPDIWKTWE